MAETRILSLTPPNRLLVLACRLLVDGFIENQVQESLLKLDPPEFMGVQLAQGEVFRN
ncbi:hypothetical protein [[Phormidium ambiguum] IAM M-71]|uniref:hypothetical protein n=1 Tax=[Phormidium ambiguum] IAM M-71 TaxID=454136 RepID=UPI0015BC7905|nr:hypothetical protein [Phormidium ambiguum]